MVAKKSAYELNFQPNRKFGARIVTARVTDFLSPYLQYEHERDWFRLHGIFINEVKIQALVDKCTCTDREVLKYMDEKQYRYYDLVDPQTQEILYLAVPFAHDFNNLEHQPLEMYDMYAAFDKIHYRNTGKIFLTIINFRKVDNDTAGEDYLRHVRDAATSCAALQQEYAQHLAAPMPVISTRIKSPAADILERLKKRS